MRIIVTCGPAYAPIDEVRRLTNFSTGSLGILLAQTLTNAGHQVLCLKGAASTYAGDLGGLEIRPFSTNLDLIQQLEDLSVSYPIGAFFHTAALSDFQVARILDAQGAEIHARKIPSRQERLTIELEPSVKVIHRLRTWFPQARLIGWKYELQASSGELIDRAQRQINEAHTDACVLNGSAYGPGFGFYLPGRPLLHLPTRPELCQHLVHWIENS